MKILKIRSIIFLFFLAYLMLPQNLFSQDNRNAEYIPAPSKNNVNLFNNGVGFRYSNFSGYGLSYSIRFLNDYTVSVTGLSQYKEYTTWEDMSKTKIVSDSKDILLNYGIELQRDIFYNNNIKIYALLGAGYEDDDKKDENQNNVEKQFSLGLGFGMQWYPHERVAAFFALAYKYGDTDIQKDNKPSVERKTTLGIEMGLMFLF